MNKFLKAGLLIVTLVIPALIFTFLNFFATNHYDLPFYHPKIDSMGKVVVLNGDTTYHKIECSGLTTIENTEISNKSLEGELTVIHYLPENCADSCKIVLNELERVYSLRSNFDDLNVLTIMGKWPPNDASQSELFKREGWKIGLFSAGAKNRVLFEDFKFQTKVEKSKTNSVGAKLVLVDRNRYIRGYYLGTDKDETDRLIAEIKILEYEKNNK